MFQLYNLIVLHTSANIPDTYEILSSCDKIFIDFIVILHIWLDALIYFLRSSLICSLQRISKMYIHLANKWHEWFGIWYPFNKKAILIIVSQPVIGTLLLMGSDHCYKIKLALWWNYKSYLTFQITQQV